MVACSTFGLISFPISRPERWRRCCRNAAPKPINDLNPLFKISGKRHGMVAQAIASIPGREFCWSVQFLTDQHDAVVRALDTLLLGF